MDEPTQGRRPAAAHDGRPITALRREIDERDETIRLLNEALSQALDEIERLNPRRAA